MMISKWLESEGLTFWLLVFVFPLYVAWIFHLVYYNMGYARNRGNFEANTRNERDFLAMQQREGESQQHSPTCQHHPDNRGHEQDKPPVFMP